MSKHSIIGTLKKIFTLTFVAGAIIVGCDKPTEPTPPVEEPGDPPPGLRVTEIHYNPADGSGIDGDSLEFIELKNVGSTSAALGGIEFVAGITYSFPTGATLLPDSFYVIASSSDNFRKRYGRSPDGDYSGQLRNSGDTISAIHLASQQEVVYQFYSDTGSWPGSADGDGYSLVAEKSDPDSGETGSDYWRPSTKLHGSPWADDVVKTIDSTLYDLRITEINYHPDYSDTLGEDSLEFIELKNVGTKELDISDVEIVGAVSYKFPSGATLKPGAFIVLASSPEWFEERYGFAPFDFYEGQLKNSSETITLQDQKAAVELLSITYFDDTPWSGEADGDGWSLVPVQPNPARAEQNNPAAWRRSMRLHGSPGGDDPEIVLVNEVLSHTDLPQVDAIELYNPNSVDVNIGGWFLSDEAVNPIKFRIPDGTVISAGGYKVFTANEFNKDTSFSSFGLSEAGDETYLSMDSTGCLGYCHGCRYGALENGISYGRYIVPSTNKEVFIPLKDVTLGEANSGPLVGPLVISEIMYQPGDMVSDFIEITNISQQEVKLYDPKNPDNTWRIEIDDDRFFNFPKEKSIKSGESVVIVSDRIPLDTFRIKGGLDVGVQLFSFTGTLPDTSAKLELEKPVEPDKDSAGVMLSPEVEYMEYDKVSYKEEIPWPTTVKGTGSSLTRIDNKAFGNDPANWKAAVATPGSVAQ